MSRLFTSLRCKEDKGHQRWSNDIALDVSCVFSCLCSRSPDATSSPLMFGLHFQSSRLGGGSSLAPAATAMAGLPVLCGLRSKTKKPLPVWLKENSLFAENVCWISYMCFITCSEHWTRTIPSKGECSHTTPHTPSIPTTNCTQPEQQTEHTPS